MDEIRVPLVGGLIFIFIELFARKVASRLSSGKNAGGLLHFKMVSTY